MLRKGLPGLLLAALAVPAAAQTVDEVIAKSLEARGGLDKLKAVQSVRMTGKMIMGPMELPMVVEMKRPAGGREHKKQPQPRRQSSCARRSGTFSCPFRLRYRFQIPR